MRKRMLRSVLVAAFSTVFIFGALGGLSDAKGDIRADTSWPAVAKSTALAQALDTSWPVPPADDGAGG
ncbi:hypothetical protein [Streptomyces europaeiscabiei]|uniref:hypothetical protein n=1 Tax=Streptomyces europaeiscabiei TaxID=146819 RepID=UPI0029B9DF62|nr:hypothetical protein [Streptomyces europaeiscabiei]MDX3587518.1 hypothetical protein [Streptomyces europaeiscabiei]MDX3617802.1 hypothetical protein [Streptomyces europaeiscabiei]MDX3631779.1 hypothetical protein [Streptomyces europaeiscabiei]MDX3649560.1 hypothetical protein [Streptomyces europaeiscabiei]WUD34373.1 hypothetical protein OG858_25190 [Streptomyces europaeiscabiei]